MFQTSHISCIFVMVRCQCYNWSYFILFRIGLFELVEKSVPRSQLFIHLYWLGPRYSHLFMWWPHYHSLLFNPPWIVTTCFYFALSCWVHIYGGWRPPLFIVLHMIYRILSYDTFQTLLSKYLYSKNSHTLLQSYPYTWQDPFRTF